jgi:hypothetical protein
MNSSELKFFLQAMKANCETNIENFAKLKKVGVSIEHANELDVGEWINREEQALHSLQRLIDKLH